MPRPVKIRGSYTNDARYMLRLKEAVEKDRRDLEFSSEVGTLLQKLAVLLTVGPDLAKVPSTTKRKKTA